MKEQIRQGIIDRLAEAFPGVPIYVERVPQDFADPSFRVKSLTSQHAHGMGPMSWRSMPFDVLYFPGSRDAPEQEWAAVEETLFGALEWVESGGRKWRAEDMTGEYDAEQTAGHLQMTFRQWLERIRPVAPPMDKVTQRGDC